MQVVRTGIFLGLMIMAASVSGRAFGRDFLHGEIETVDRAARVMTVRVDRETGDDRLIRVMLPDAFAGDEVQAGATLPGCIAAGRHVRVWGQARQSEDSAFRADEVRGCGMSACSDPTGVRARLFRNRQEKIMGGMCR